MVGRVIDALGRPLDGKETSNHGRPLVESQHRDCSTPVYEPMQTGSAIDAMIPIGRGQRNIGDRQTGKTVPLTPSSTKGACHLRLRRNRSKVFHSSSGGERLRERGRWTTQL